MSKLNRREGLERLAALAMLGASLGTAGYVNRKEIAKILPKRYPHWEPSVVILHELDSNRISYGQGSVINSTKIRLWCEENNYKMTSILLSDDIGILGEQVIKMRETAFKNGVPSFCMLNRSGYLSSWNVPASIDDAISMLDRNKR